VMGEIFFDYPSDSAIDKGDVVSPKRTIFYGTEVSRIGFVKRRLTRLAQFEFLSAITEIEPPLAVAILEASDVTELIGRCHSVLQSGSIEFRPRPASWRRTRHQAPDRSHVVMPSMRTGFGNLPLATKSRNFDLPIPRYAHARSARNARGGYTNNSDSFSVMVFLLPWA